ncbi:MAG: leucine--tRNA ligase [Candidatus Riflebacteria bacterium RBG_13_59_9]|nr:MAG: leucine--tRNA ligase [Candidatus Riflebacteria bacterium RBG_13_59_9]
MAEYDFRRIEKQWQHEWTQKKAFAAGTPVDPEDKAYVLVMFPYPSGDLHMGHLRNYTIGDVVARYRRLQGKNVLNPMGWDAFGLPAEQSAIDQGIHPRELTDVAVANYRRQLMSAGISYDWDREVNTSSPEYYRWTQWLFLKLYAMGLVYKRDAPVNWCQEHGVLANEEAADGTCWRCGKPVVRRNLSQWFICTTEFVEELLAGIGDLVGWPDNFRTMQRNWIGRSEGTRVHFQIPSIEETVDVFTTRADTLFGVTFLSIAPEHPLAERLAEAGGTTSELAALRERVARQTAIERGAEEREKEGVNLGVSARHPLTGEEAAIFAADYVLMEYGTGIVMGVPGHDTRDYAFAQKYAIPITRVIKEADGSEPELPFTGYGVMADSGKYSGLTSNEGIAQLNEDLAEMAMGGSTVQYKLRDWLVSRQRYWGVPIPLISCASCGYVPVPYAELPVLLPEKVQFSGETDARLATNREFIETTCPKCGGAAEREADTMSTFVCSSWYYLRFTDPHNNNAPFDPDTCNAWMPVDNYVGGKEHVVGHMLYSRFICHALSRAGMLSFREPIKRYFSQGILYKDGAKMSKSRGNVVSIDHFIDRYGADTARMISLFWGPPERDVEWQEGGVGGCFRFLKRLHSFFLEIWPMVADSGEPDLSDTDDDARRILNITHAGIHNITVGMDDWHLNTVVSSLMVFFNSLSEFWQRLAEERKQEKNVRALMRSALIAYVRMLSPIAPHVAEEFWRAAGQGGFVMHSRWPAYDERFLAVSEIEYGVSVNGKPRSRVMVPVDTTDAELEKLALADEKVEQHIAGKKVVKVIVVRDRLVNIVVK